MKTFKYLQPSLIVLLANLCILFNSCNSVSGKISNFTGYQSGNSVVLTWDYTGYSGSVRFNLYRNGERADYDSFNLTTWGEGEQICIDNSPSGGPNISYRIEYENPDGDEVFATASTVVYYDNNNSGNNNNGENNGENNGNNNNNQTDELDRPTGLSASAQSESITLSWNSVSRASGYYVYRSSSSSGYYDKIGTADNTYYTDNSPLEGNNYYKIKAYNSSTESNYSDYAYCKFNKKEEVKKPSAPTGVTAEFAGSTAIPQVFIKWNEVENATSYKVYRSTSANGYYSQIGYETNKAQMYDYEPKTGTNYYKVTAVNSAGESEYSNYAKCTYDPNDVSPCPVQYGNCTATSTTITLRWTNPTTSGCGKPDKAILRVRHPDSGQYADLETLSGTATSASFAFGMWLDDNGYVYCGIITENEHGSSGGISKIYDYNNKRWIN